MSIIIEQQGGLGNQLFQLSLALSIHKKSSEKITLNPAYYTLVRSRTNELKRLRIPFTFISLLTSPLEFALGVPMVGEPWEKIYLKLVGRYQIVEEKQNYTFDTAVLSTLSKTYVRGFWQHRYYVDPVIHELKTTLPSLKSSSLSKAINTTNSVAVHIRRGDYLKSAAFPFIGLEYYQAAIQMMKKKVNQPHFFVFSDDMPWAKANLSHTPHITFCEGTSGALEDLQLMTLCQHYIIANSTFSWWGARLSAHQGIVIAPDNWVNNPTAASALLYPEWLLI